MKLKKAFKNDPPTTDPKLYLKYRPTGIQQLLSFPLVIYHYEAFPDIIKLTKYLNNYMNPSEIEIPISTLSPLKLSKEHSELTVNRYHH
jgi:hypothetical protein